MGARSIAWLRFDASDRQVLALIWAAIVLPPLAACAAMLLFER